MTMLQQDDGAKLQLTRKQFERVRQIVYQKCGINLTPGKEELVKARLIKRLNALDLRNFDEYLEFATQEKSGKEMSAMLDVLTTNKTYFYRESEHFDYLCQNIFPQLARQRRVRIWSAGCSSGEEPYTLGVLFREYFSEVDRCDLRILATDLSTQVLAKARAATYGEETLRELPQALRKKHFTPVQAGGKSAYRVSEKVCKLIHFARLNLLSDWAMSGPFDVIFCRNVMIYFDSETRQNIVQRYARLLRPGGYLFIGLSESLNGISHQLHYVQPAVYMK